MNEADKTIFKNFKVKPLSKDGVLFFRSSILYRGSQTKRIRKLVFPWFLKMLKGDKYFELVKTAKSPKVIRAYRNRSFPFIYLTGLANKDFTLLLTFSSTPILIALGALSDALLNRHSYNNVLITLEMRSLFLLNRANTTQ
jgi:hypothetical protein